MLRRHLIQTPEKASRQERFTLAQHLAVVSLQRCSRERGAPTFDVPQAPRTEAVPTLLSGSEPGAPYCCRSSPPSLTGCDAAVCCMRSGQPWLVDQARSSIMHASEYYARSQSTHARTDSNVGQSGHIQDPSVRRHSACQLKTPAAKGLNVWS
jgi:hypothetical protein